MKRELVIRVEGRGTEGDGGSVILYRLGERILLLTTVEKNGEAEVVLDKGAAAALAEALRNI